KRSVTCDASTAYRQNVIFPPVRGDYGITPRAFTTRGTPRDAFSYMTDERGVSMKPHLVILIFTILLFGYLAPQVAMSEDAAPPIRSLGPAHSGRLEDRRYRGKQGPGKQCRGYHDRSPASRSV